MKMMLPSWKYRRLQKVMTCTTANKTRRKHIYIALTSVYGLPASADRVGVSIALVLNCESLGCLPLDLRSLTIRSRYWTMLLPKERVEGVANNESAISHHYSFERKLKMSAEYLSFSKGFNAPTCMRTRV